MKIYPVRRLGLIALASAVLISSACKSANAPAAKEIQSYRAGDLLISLLSGSGDLAQGQNNFIIAFRTANNQPVDAGVVALSASMSMPGMTPMTAPIELQPAGQTGQYAVKGDFGMSGAWRFEVRWDGPAGKGSTSFNSNVR